MNHPLFRRFENELSVGEQKLEWTTRGADLFARPLGGALDVVWCWPTEYGVGLRGKTEALVQVMLKKNAAYRFWPLEENEVVLLGQNHGFLRSSASLLLLRFALPRRFFGSVEVLNIEATHFQLLMEQLKSQEELILVREWAAKIPDSWQWLKWQRGSREELEPLITSLLVLLGGGEFSFAPHRKHLSLNFHGALHFDDPTEQERGFLFANVLDRFFGAHINPNIKRLYLAPRKPSLGRQARIAIHSGAPTQHERLEALLLWRDYLKDKMTPEEIEVLLLKTD